MKEVITDCSGAGRDAMHKPHGPSSGGWAQMVAEQYGGDCDSALVAHGWNLHPNGACSTNVCADDYWRQMLVCAIPLAEGWMVDDNFGQSEAYVATREEALSLADSRAWDEQLRRRAYLESLANCGVTQEPSKQHGNEEFCELDIPF